MSHAIEILAVDGSRREVALGRTPHVLAELALQVVPVAGGVRVEPTQAGALLHVEGEDLLCKQLFVGEFVTVAGVRLRCLRAAEELSPTQGAPVAVASKRTATAARVRSPGRAPSARSSSQPAATASRRVRRKTSWLPASAITAAILVVVVFVMQRLRNSTWPHSPKHFLELAHAQFDNSEPERALETLSFAMRDGTGEVREMAIALDKRIRRRLLDNASAAQVSAAEQQHDLLQSFVASYLNRPERPAAREYVRLCDDWLSLYREACMTHSQGQPMLDWVEQTRERYAAAAELHQPESAADVIFAASSRMRFQWRDYIGALARFDAFLQADTANEAVIAARKAMLEEGEEWFQTRMRRLDGTIQRGDVGNAERDLAQLDRWVAIPQWLAQIGKRRQRLAALR